MTNIQIIFLKKTTQRKINKRTASPESINRGGYLLIILREFIIKKKVIRILEIRILEDFYICTILTILSIFTIFTIFTTNIQKLLYVTFIYYKQTKITQIYNNITIIFKNTFTKILLQKVTNYITEIVVFTKLTTKISISKYLQNTQKLTNINSSTYSRLPYYSPKNNIQFYNIEEDVTKLNNIEEDSNKAESNNSNQQKDKEEYNEGKMRQKENEEKQIELKSDDRHTQGYPDTFKRNNEEKIIQARDNTLDIA